MNILIRKGKREDLSQVLALIRELAEFEKAPDAVSNTLEDMERDGFGEQPVFGFHIAETTEKIVGIAVYFIKYSTWKGKGLFLDDLIVTEQFRSRGIGRSLFDAFIAEARTLGCRQVHWQVLDWNTPAITFYKNLGATVDAEWLDCKLSEEQIQQYKSGLQNEDL